MGKGGIMDHGFVRVAAAVPVLRVSDCIFNSDNISEMINEADARGVQLIVFPELSITAYTCADLFHQHFLLQEAERGLGSILEKTGKKDITAVVGMPVYRDNQLFNCGVVINRGKILGVVPKSYIPGFKEFYEERWFAPGTKALSDTVILCGAEAPFGIDLLFQAKNMEGFCLGVEICEDLWVPIPPSCYQSVNGATILANLSASNDIIGKNEYRRNLAAQQSGRCIAGYIYASCGVWESTTDVVFGGDALIAENGSILGQSKRFLREKQFVVSEIDIQRLINDRFKNTSFMEDIPERKFRKISFRIKENILNDLTRNIDPHPFVPSDEAARDVRCAEIFDIQTAGLAKRICHTDAKCSVLGISGGLDSTLALLVTARTYDLLGKPRKDIVAVTMPGFGTTDRTYENALRLMKAIGVTAREIDIKDSCLKHFDDIGHDAEQHDVTYENVQARERTQVLMDIANKQGGLVIGTGDLSELALGWCTYNGDHMSMYAVNCSVPKTLVQYLVRWVADNVVDTETRDVLYEVLDTPITPELLPPDEKGGINQKTEDIIGPYELHDFFLYHIVRYGAAPEKVQFLAEKAFAGKYPADVIKSWLRVFYKRFFTQQFKRSCIPDGPKVGSISLSPRGDWRMPSDASYDMWLKALE